MVVSKKFKAFDDALLDQHPELKKFLLPSDQYSELNHILNFNPINLPVGSMNTKVIINDGEIIERVYKTPKGEVVSLFSKSSNRLFDHAA